MSFARRGSFISILIEYWDWHLPPVQFHAPIPTPTTVPRTLRLLHHEPASGQPGRLPWRYAA